jgi:hypothetical protein
MHFLSPFPLSYGLALPISIPSKDGLALAAQVQSIGEVKKFRSGP